MTLELIIFLVLASIYAIALFYTAAKTGSFLKTISYSAAAGLAVFALLGLTAPFTGIWLPFNPWSLGTSAAVGLPGVVAMLLARMIFI